MITNKEATDLAKQRTLFTFKDGSTGAIIRRCYDEATVIVHLTGKDKVISVARGKIEKVNDKYEETKP